jgi:C4-dicarboxylate-specific signal transduction histidine kinase
MRALLHEARVSGSMEATYRIQCDDEKIRWIASAFQDYRIEGEPEQEIIGYWLDVTRDKDAESQVQHGARLLMLGEMATGLAHELNQPLNVIRLAADNVRYQLTELAEGTVSTALLDRLDRIEKQTIRASQIVDRMRIFGRRTDHAMLAVDPAVVVLDAVQAVKTLFMLRNVAIEVISRDALPRVMVDCRQIEQAIVNLLMNALDATVSANPAAAADEAALSVRITVRLSPDETRAWIEVEDDGGGIGADAERIFDPFFTTKSPGQGMGLGLSICYGIVRDHHGELTFQNTSTGVIFRIALPLLA